VGVERKIRGIQPDRDAGMLALPEPRAPMDASAWAGLAVWVLATVTAGAAVGALFAPDAWFAALAKPTWNPPSWLFAPMWTLLYVLLGVACWLVAREPGVAPQDRQLAWLAFGLQAALNLAWTPLFFGLRQPGWAFVDICLLWPAVLWMTMRFGRIRPLAGYLMAPYVLWVSFALVLNGTIWLMNE
jgi:tryptophan-rich sensory protein